MPHLNGYAHDGAASSLLEGDATTAEAAGAVNRRTAVLFRKSKAASPHKPPRDGDRATDVGAEAGKEGQDADEAQLASKSFLSVVIPRLETLLHKRKRKHNGGGGSEGEEEEGEGEEDEAPVKRLNTGEGSRARRAHGPLSVAVVCSFSVPHLLPGLSSGFLGGEEEKELSESPSRAGQAVEPRRRCASESSISSSSSLQGSTRYLVIQFGRDVCVS